VKRFGAAVLLAALLAGCASSGVPRPPPAESDGRVLVTLRAGSEARWRTIARELTALTGARLEASWLMASLGEQCLVFAAPGGRSADEVAGRLRPHPEVSGASPVQRFRVLGEPAAGLGDPYRHLQTMYGELRLAPAHRVATGRGVAVAVVDTGLDLEHPELARRIAGARDFVRGRGGSFTTDLHGTAVAGLIAAEAGNGIGIAGVAPEAELWALKACWQEAPQMRSAVCDSYTLAQALDFALTSGVRIVNLSLTGAPDLLLERLLEAARLRGTLVVAAAEGDPPSFPASAAGVLAVHGWAGESPVTAGAPRVPDDALVAPGVDLLTTVPRGGYDFFSGSSFAAAQASGVAALLLERHPGLAPEEIARLLRASAVPVVSGENLAALKLDACAALALAGGRGSCEPTGDGPR
jgi:hypothetical protein